MGESYLLIEKITPCMTFKFGTHTVIVQYPVNIFISRLSYDDAYSQLKQWLDSVKQQIDTDWPFKGTLIEKQEQLEECQVTRRI